MTIDSIYRPEDFLPDGENEFTFQFEHIGAQGIEVRALIDGVWVELQPEVDA